MAQQTLTYDQIHLYPQPNPGDSTERGDSWRTTLDKINSMFSELYARADIALRAIMPSIQSFTSNVLTDVTSLSVNVQAGHTYSFEVCLFVESMDVNGGTQAAMSGTATFAADKLHYAGWAMDYSTGPSGTPVHGYAMSEVFGGVVASSAGFTNPLSTVIIKGSITVLNAGTLKVQFAQNTTSITPSVVALGSYFLVRDMGV